MDLIQHGMPLGPPTNIFGDLGPRCESCSGLGHFLRPNMTSGLSGTRYTTKCTCKGTGVDIEVTMRNEIDALVRRIADMEQNFLKQLEARTPKHRKPRIPQNSRQFWCEMIAWATADGTAVANNTTEAILMPNVLLPGNYMQDGRVLSVHVAGRWGIQAAANTLRFRLRWGGVAGTVIFDTGNITGSAGAVTNGIWRMDVNIQTRVNGSSGSLFPIGSVVLNTAAAPTIGTVAAYGLEVLGSSAGVSAPAAATCDLTADTNLAVTMTWGTANAANTAQGHNYLLESKN